MGLPRKLKNMNLFIDGRSYVGEAEEVTPPKLTRKTEAYRAAGMAGAAHIDLGLEDDALKAEFTLGGHVGEVVKQMGRVGIDGVLLRFAGAFRRDDTGEYTAVELVMRGRITEIDRGTYKVGDNSQMKFSMHNVYYKEIENKQVLMEVDVLNNVHIVNGVDLLREERRAIGQ
ncbi:MAG: phage major tail tube protein [Gammaproteobacteria bacterium HGW-Gammaproteobacteria-8]|nr:MAG: phage major tail tube protein [Gammaproteobacteria bacterium HGW-Gammaproteobacteria-8]